MDVRRAWLGPVAAAVLAGCLEGSPLGLQPDGGAGGSPDALRPPDGPVPEAAVPDAVVPEAAFPEAAVPDAAVPDAAVPDAAVPDAAVPDAAVPDAAMPDAAVPDAAVPDAAVPDAALPDASPPDASCAGTLCGSNCVNLQTDPNHCGRCDIQCASGTQCLSGLCVCSAGPPCQCPPGTTLCGNACIDTQTDPTNCGFCGHVCSFSANSYPICTGGGCSIGCNSGFANCDRIDANGCETSLASDPASCGACGHDCRGGACQAGLCQPVPLVVDSVGALAVDATHLYWIGVTATGMAAIKRIPLAGGSVEVLTDGGGERVGGPLALDASFIYYANTVGNGPFYTTIRKIAKAGGTPSALATLDPWDSVASLAVDGSFVYLTGEEYAISANVVRKLPLSGGALTTLASVPDPAYYRSIVLDGTSVYWLDGPYQPVPGAVLKVGKDGTNLRTLLSLPNGPQHLTSDASHLYWTNGYDGNVMRMGLDGSAPTELAFAQTNPGALVVDATNLYWSDQGDTTGAGRGLVRMPLAGGPAVTISSLGPSYLVQDSSTLYMATNAIYRLVK